MNAPQTWAEGVQRLNDEAAGVMALQVIQHGDLPELVAYALAGDREAARLAKMVSDTVLGIERAPRKQPMLCGSCPRPLRDFKFSIVVALPVRDDASQGLALAICHRCGTTHEAVQAKAVVALQRLWSDLRPINVTHLTGGRA